MDWRSPLARFSGATVVYTVGVILFGAFVRASGSGAGCGRSWPVCQGELIPAAGGTAQAVEFTHRLTSGLTGVLIVALVWAVFRRFGPGHPARKAAMWSLFFVIVEGLFGAVLVRAELVADDASVARAIIVPSHLANTLLLLAALVLTTWFVAGGDSPRLLHGGRLAALVGVGALAMVALSATGAVSALADTLFPKEAVGGSLITPGAESFLTNLRIVHPVGAVGVGAFLAWLAVRYGRREGRGEPAATAIVWLVAIQLLAGLVNVLLLTPIWMQIVHLFLADALWVAFLWFGVDALSDPRFRVIEHREPAISRR